MKMGLLEEVLYLTHSRVDFVLIGYYDNMPVCSISMFMACWSMELSSML